MLKPEDAVSLKHMLDAAGKALQFSCGRSRSDLDADEMFALALVRLLEIIGEAAKRLSPELRQQCPGIPWKQIAGTRDRLIHGYFHVDLDIIWAIITDDLPILIAEGSTNMPRASRSAIQQIFRLVWVSDCCEKARWGAADVWLFPSCRRLHQKSSP